MNENSIRLPGIHEKLIKEFYQNRLSEIEQEANEIRALLKDMSNGQSAYTGTPLAMPAGQTSYISSSDFPKVYNPKWANQKKAQFVLRAKGVPLTSGEIVDYIVNEYEIGIEGGRKRLLGSMSSVLSGNCKPGDTFVRTKNDLDEWIYDIAVK